MAAKFVIAGSSDCPHFARVELLADDLSRNLPNFHLHKIVKKPTEWKSWLNQCCKERGWHHHKSPIVWRELVNRGGKGVLIGGANEFQEYAKCYYDFASDMLSDKMLSIAEDNVRFKNQMDEEDAYLRSLSTPLRITLTAANAETVYQLLPMLASGSVFGKTCELAFTLFDANVNSLVLEGLAMETFDLSSTLVRRISTTTDPSVAFKDAEIIVFLDEILLSSSETDNEDDSRQKWLEENSRLTQQYAAAVQTYCANSNVKIVFAGRGPVNFNCRIFLEHCSTVQKYNVVALAKLFERQVKGILAKKMLVNSASVADVLIWGDPSGKHHIDLSCAKVFQYDGSITGDENYHQPVLETIWDKKWLVNDLPVEAAERSKGNVTGTNKQQFVSSAQATADFLKDWWNGSLNRAAEVHSLGVYSEGWYGVPSGVVATFPVSFSPKGYWTILQDMDVSEELEKQIKEASKELLRDYHLVFPSPQSEPEKAETHEEDDHHPTVRFSEDNILNETDGIELEQEKSKDIDLILE